ncbi:MAG: DUF2309 domain-containing protein [Methylotenera sp.]|nr:DUF2309 domain-containing protein [Methylotenera sp.]MDO9233471.1 DUF2309 domain-containing protein [Methylotenera sp.]MDP2403238.1 DUF2309 domain-containing protein [Methylotenera sp.]MDP3095258.1 DUF2309 domain-containing protein [Methylotenera sp.]
MMHTHTFDEQHALHLLRHYLPSQSPLKDFIHHNSLHAFQNLKFYEAIFKASKMFGFQATTPLNDFRQMYANGRIDDQVLNRVIAQRQGEGNVALWREKALVQSYNEHVESRVGRLRALWKSQYQIDMDNAVQPLLFRLLGHYLDQGVAMWQFPQANAGLLQAVRHLEQHSYVSLFKTKRAKELLLSQDLSIAKLLNMVVGNEAYYEQYLFDQQFGHRGWSGMVATVETSPNVMLDRKEISLKDFILVELLLEIDYLDGLLVQWQPIAHDVSTPPTDFFADLPYSELNEVLKIWQDAFEWSYYDHVLAGIQICSGKLKTQSALETNKSFQALFCIDERECSIRRHVEHADQYAETFGTPGFFSAEFFFLPQNGKFYEKLCPAPVTPKYLIKEFNVTASRAHDVFYTPKTHQAITGFLCTFTFGFWAALRLVQNLFRPKMAPAISNAFSVMQSEGQLTVVNAHPDDRENDLQIGFTVDEMAARVLSLLSGIALTKDFAPIVYLIAHGSSSANNPHHGAHDCGACSGRPGAVNARVVATMANHPDVRKVLQNVGIHITESTQFVGGMHDTAADEIEFYDVHFLNAENAQRHEANIITFERACDLNAKERSRRFASINTKAQIGKIRQAIKARSVSLFEPRPELGHGTNTLCIVGRRALTKDLFLDRRAFMNSYDYSTDLEGKLLANIMKPLGPVCGGINLEYYFSRVDNYKLGAGTKLPHNVVGLFGVANSSDGDLRPGLPWQMVEVHDPLRLLIVVEHFPQVVLQAIQSTPEMYEWFINEWVHLSVIHPESHDIYYFRQGAFVAYQTLTKSLPDFTDINLLLEQAKSMRTNHLPEATQENLPVYLNQ